MECLQTCLSVCHSVRSTGGSGWDWGWGDPHGALRPNSELILSPLAIISVDKRVIGPRLKRLLVMNMYVKLSHFQKVAGRLGLANLT